MREILFRGKRIHNGEWVDGSPVFYGEKVIMIEPKLCIKEVPSFGWVQGEVIPETVGQFTGLCDKNGKKVFEGDLLEARNGNIYGVYFKECTYKITDEFGDIIRPTQRAFDYMQVEVVNNIHDNPELLEMEE